MGRPVSRRTVISRLLDELKTPVFLVGADYKIVYANAALAQWLRLDPDGIAGLECRYSAESGSPVAGLSPPPEVFTGRSTVASVWRALPDGSTESRSARYVALDQHSAGGPCVLVVVESPPETTEPLACNAAQTIRSSVSINSTELHSQLWHLRGSIADQYRIDELIGQTPAMQRVRELVRLAVADAGNVTVWGEDGTGREHVARAIHHSSAGDAGPLSATGMASNLAPLATLSCPVLDTELLETTVSTFLQRCAELELPQVPMLLLLDVDQLDASVQVALSSLLNVPELGLRCVCTARHSLIECVRERDYHKGLAYNLGSLEIELPPLAERSEDIPLLVQHFVEQWNLEAERQVQGFTDEAIGHFLVYPWSTHVLELRELVHAACAEAQGATVGVESLPFALRAGLDAVLYAKQEPTLVALDALLEGVEAKAITEALRLSDGNRSEAARMLDISRARLLRRIDHFSLGEPAADEASLRGPRRR